MYAIFPFLFLLALVLYLAIGFALFLHPIFWWTERRFRIHLSTLLVCTIVVGALMGVTIRPDEKHVIGWPFAVHIGTLREQLNDYGTIRIVEFLVYVPIDVLVFLNIPTLIAKFLEGRIARQAKGIEITPDEHASHDL